MAFQVLHMQKIKMNALGGIQSHNRREHESKTNKDIDHSRIHENFSFESLSDSKTYNRAFKERLEEVGYTRKLREDVVGCGSFLVSASREFFQERTAEATKKYFEDCAEFIKGKYGSENVLYANVHMDEATPHMHLGIIPITEDGRLSAKDVFSKKNGFEKLQEHFNEFLKVKGYELEKGEKTENTKHLSELEFKAQQEEKKLNLAKEELLQVENDFEEKKTTVDSLNSQINERTTTLRSLDGFNVQEIENIDSRAKTGLLGGVTLKRDDYEKLKDSAKSTVVAQVEIKRLSGTVKTLESNVKHVQHEYSKLKQENTRLVEENKKLNSTLSEFKQAFDEIAGFVEEKGLLNGFKDWFAQKQKEREARKQAIKKEVKPLTMDQRIAGAKNKSDNQERRRARDMDSGLSR